MTRPAPKPSLEPRGLSRADAALTMDQAAACLNVSVRWLRDFLKANEVGYLAAGRKKLFDITT
jgi:hypothetical protein